jgi:3-oxoacyl-[acyl-carrier-protein] synthase-3
MYHSKIAGLGYFVPSNVVTNDDRNVSTPMTSGFRKELELGKEDTLYREKIPLPQWGVKAAEILIKRLYVAKEDIDFVVLPH